MPSPRVLVWLFAHGALVWQAALAILLLTAAALARRRTRRRAKARAAARRAPLGQPLGKTAELHEGPALLAGRIEAEAADPTAVTALVYRAGLPGSDTADEPMAHARAGHLVLTVGDERVAIEGAVDVIIGSRERPFRRARPRPEALSAALEPWDHRLDDLVITERTLSSGDEVWAAGSLERGGGESKGSYRDRAEKWRLVPPPAPRGQGISLAFAGTPRARDARSVLSYALHLAAAGLLFLAVFGVGGQYAFEPLRPSRPLALPNIPASEAVRLAAWVSVAPFHRERVRDALVTALETRAAEDPESFAWLDRLDEAEGRTSNIALRAILHGDLVRGAELAEAAGANDLAAQAWYALGELERASRAWERVRDEAQDTRSDRFERRRFGVRVHLLASRVDLAAAEARALMKVAPRPRGFRLDNDLEERRCLLNALEARTGNREARSALQRANEWFPRHLCAVLFADLLTGPERTRFLDARREEWNSYKHPPDTWFELLAAESDLVGHVAPHQGALEYPGQLAGNPALVLGAGLPAVARSIAEALERARPAGPEGRLSMARVAGEMAALAVVGGDGESEARLVAAAGAERASELMAVLALLRSDEQRFLATARKAGTLTPMVAGLEEVLAGGGRSKLFEIANLFGAAENKDRRQALAGAEIDGARLVSLIRDPPAPFARACDAQAEAARALRILAPGLRQGRDEALRWVRRGPRETMWQLSPLRRMIAWSDLAAAADTLGDAALAATFRARARRFHDALMKRDLAVPLAALEAL